MNFPSIQFLFHSHDLPLALAIQTKLGFGSLIKTKGINGYRLTINTYAGIRSMIDILNGRMRTSKVKLLAQLLD